MVAVAAEEMTTGAAAILKRKDIKSINKLIKLNGWPGILSAIFIYFALIPDNQSTQQQIAFHEFIRSKGRKKIKRKDYSAGSQE
jgi:hypothetical protein